MSLMTCRFCGKSEYDHEKVVHYSVRHYAHYECYLKAGKSLNDLHDWQIIKFPYRLLKKFGFLNEASAALERLNKESAA